MKRKKIIETYTVQEVAEALKLHPYTIRRLCRESKIPVFKFGGQWRFRKEDIEKYLRSKITIR
ncbi:MAG TPA: DNA-binding protein [Candidatus Omnitrophica bacterium]|nr:DNA-binding protein [Candidatus Omnitrophota bacterium]